MGNRTIAHGQPAAPVKHDRLKKLWDDVDQEIQNSRKEPGSQGVEVPAESKARQGRVRYDLD